MFKVERNGVPFPANSAAVVELQDGDILLLASAVSARCASELANAFYDSNLVSVRWLPVCVYLPSTRGRTSTSLESCAALGESCCVSVVRMPIDVFRHQGGTHL